MDIEEIIAKIKEDGEMIFPAVGGWRLKLMVDDDGNIVFVHYNPWQGDESKHAFFEYTNALNPMGAGIMVQEPTLRVPFAGTDIVGAVVLNRDNKVVDRFGWSKLVYVQNRQRKISPEGELSIDGKSVGYVNTLFDPDKNRLQGSVAFVRPDPVDQVQKLELEDLEI